MKKAVNFKTSQGNLYLYSPFRNQLLLCHPLVQYLFELNVNGADLKQHVSLLKSSGKIVIPQYGSFSHKELLYQLKKFNFLKKHHFFKTPKSINLNGRLLPSRVEKNITMIQQVIFETTEDCNLSCTYCTFSKFYINKERGKRKFNAADAKKALDYLLSARDNHSGQLIISFYGGEPLKNFRFIKEIVEYATIAYGKRHSFKFTMSSNGLLLSKYAGFLTKHDFDISVSLDGDEAGNSFRVLPNYKSSFNLVVKNLDFVKEHYPEYFEKSISFLTVLHNKNSFTGVNDFFMQKYGKIPLASLISTQNINDPYRDEFQKTFLDGTRNDDHGGNSMQNLFMNHPVVKELANTIEKYSGYVFKNHFQVMSRVNGNSGTKEFVPTATCSPFSMRVFLTADGCIVPCEHISRVFEIGQLNNSEIHIRNESVAHMFNKCFDKIRPVCNQCFLADNCKECVFNTRVETDDPLCEYFMDEKKFSQYLARSFNAIEENFPLYRRVIKEAYHEEK